MQMLMIRSSKGAEMLASSAMQASANMGNALGAFLGGLPIAAGYGYTSPEYVGALMAFGGLLLCLVLTGLFNAKAKLVAANA
jgi:DHA1 family arabinose polymer transporter-like MFS transporter